MSSSIGVVDLASSPLSPSLSSSMAGPSSRTRRKRRTTASVEDSVEDLFREMSTPGSRSKQRNKNIAAAAVGMNGSNSNNGVQLLGSGNMTSARKRRRRTPRFRDDNAMMASNNQSTGGSNAKQAAATEVIDLLEDTPPSPGGASQSVGKRTRFRRRFRRIRDLNADDGNDNDDDDVIEIISPPRGAARSSAAAATVAAASTKQSPTSPMVTNAKNINYVQRVRDVFPQIGRAKVESFLSMAKMYDSSGDTIIDAEDIFQTVMGVLSENSNVESITDATFAAASIIGGKGGGGGGGGTSSAMTSSTSTNNAGRGKRKVAELECQCCFAEYPFENMVSCKGGHLFCNTCLRRHTETRVFGVGNLGVKHNNGTNNTKSTSKALEILCMASDCTCGFHEEQLRKTLDEKVLKKYNELQFAAVLEGMTDIGKCPKCHFIAVPDPQWPATLFRCPECNHKSCRECAEEYHPDIRCDQVESKTEADGRTKVEEAMTLAMVRTCPRPMCRKKFLKNDGCNKMTCSCGCYICYVCRKEIPHNVAYTHFCQTPHCNHKKCNKCPLYADTSQQDKDRVKNAANKAARSVRKTSGNIDVNSMLKDPPHTQGRRR